MSERSDAVLLARAQSVGCIDEHHALIHAGHAEQALNLRATLYGGEPRAAILGAADAL